MSLARWLEPLPDSALMREWDRWAIEDKGIPSSLLMERAGEGLATVIARRAPAGRIAIVCGKGNNGGDGLVAARLLRKQGREVEVLLVWPGNDMSPDARAQILKLPGLPPIPWDPTRLHHAHLVVDALLGTGFDKAPRDPLREVIAVMNACGRPIVAADVPSGVDASTGQVRGHAVRAVATATFHRGKPGLWISPGKEHSGKVTVVDIGIPRGTPGQPDIGLITPAVLRGIPKRGAASNKFTSGTVFVCGGSPGLTGAPRLAALGAMRAGAGYVTLGVPRALQVTMDLALLEVMVKGLPDVDTHLCEEAVDEAIEAIGRSDAVVLGPGIGRQDGTAAFVRALAERIDIPLVLDADGLNAFAGRLKDLQKRRRFHTVLTPHTGELGRLLDVPREEVEANRLQCARAAAAKARAFVVLKGDDTLIVAPPGRTAISAGEAPGLATAGTGDVLSGIIAALLAKGLAPAHAACAAVHVHVRAGQLAAAPNGPDGVVASDVIAAVPAALNGA